MARSARASTIASIGEFGFLAKLLPRVPLGPNTIIGPGQDCAVVRCGRRRLLLTVDALIEGLHFESAWMSPHQIGRKSFLVNASDVAAMGGSPRFCVVNLGAPSSYRARDLLQLQAGIVAAARAHGADVVGGNLSRTEQVSVVVALLADAPRRLVTRQGARAGDRIYVTGTLGDAALGVRLLSEDRGGRMTAHPLRRFREPSPRLRAGQMLVASGIVSAMIDVSDGLLQDLGHLCHESRTGAVLRTDDVPLSPAYRALLPCGDTLALHGGEDYELLCTVPERKVKQLARLQAKLGCPIHCIGEMTSRRGVRVDGATVPPNVLASGGYDQFKSQA